MSSSANPRVFISYSRTDGTDIARKLDALLTTEGLSVFRDLRGMDGDDSVWPQIMAAIKAAEHLVLVLTPGALDSQYVRKELDLARQEGKPIWMVTGPARIDAARLPLWMKDRHRHDLAEQENVERLVLGLKGPQQPQRRVPFMADALRTGFVERPEKFEEIKRKLLDSRGEPVAITAALRGAGGYGKTSLANALCHDPDIREAFDGGILRVTLGEKCDDLVGFVAELIVMLTGERPDVTRLDAAKARLAEALDDRRCLLVIDDAWRAEDLAPFLHRGPKDQTTRLVTTRDDAVLPSDAVRVPVDAMTSSQALSVLAHGLPTGTLDAHRHRLDALAARLGEWPLLLALANGVLRARVDRGSTVAAALDYAERALEQRGLGGAFPTRDPTARRTTAAGTLDLSLEQLTAEERLRFRDLAVFVEDAEIPVPAALGLWHQTAGLDPLDGEDLLTRLDQLSLLIDLDLGRSIFRLHDVFRALMRSDLSQAELAGLDGALMAHFRSTCPHGDLAQLTDVYGLRHAIAHLHGSGDADIADALLLDPGWMQNKLGPLGIQLLLADYAYPPPKTAVSRVEAPLRPAVSEVEAALRLAAYALALRPYELPCQLIARLHTDDAEGLEACLATAHALLRPPALVPLRPTFTALGAELRRCEGHQMWVNSVAVLPNNRHAVSAASDYSLRLWDLDSGFELRRLNGHGAWVQAAVKLPDLPDPKLRDGVEVGWVNAVALLPDGVHALSGSDDQTLKLWDLETGVGLSTFRGHTGPVTAVAVLPNGEQALSGADDKTIRLWDLSTGKELRRIENADGQVRCVAVLPNGRHGLSGSTDGTVRLWNLETGAEVRCLTGHTDWVACLAVLGNGRLALSGSADKTVRLWDLETGTELRRFEGHEEPVNCVAVLPDEAHILSGSSDDSIRMWDISNGEEVRRLDGHGDEVRCLAVLSDGRRVLSGGYDRTLRLWNLKAEVAPNRFEDHGDPVREVAFAGGRRHVLSASDDKTLRLWDINTGAALRTFRGHTKAVNCVAMLAEGRQFLSGSSDHTIRLWNVDNGAELSCLTGHTDWVRSLAMLPDGKHVLSASDDLSLCLWDIDGGVEVRRLVGHKRPVNGVVVLPEGRRALSASSDETLRLWDLDTGSELRCFEGHRGDVTSVALLPGGQRALSGSYDETLRLWDVHSGCELGCLAGHQRAITCVAVLDDGKRALSAAYDGTMRLWDIGTGHQLACLTFDAVPHAIAWNAELRLAVVGDALGRVHLIGLFDKVDEPPRLP